MKKILRATMALVMVLAFGVNTQAFAYDVTGSVGASATIEGVHTLSVSGDITFGTIGGGTGNLAYGTPITVNYDSNEAVWKINIYTNNTGLTGDQRGGLAKSTNDNRVPLVWQIYDATATATFTDPDEVGNEWAYVKDLGDIDWATAFADGYTDLCYGGPDYTNLSAFPSVPADRAGTSPIYVYIGGMFGPAPAGSYTTTINLDLYHE